MIIRGRIAMRLAGRKRDRVPTDLATGIAHLVVTGFFYRIAEQELAPAGETAARLLAAIRAAHPLTMIEVSADGLGPGVGELVLPRDASEVELTARSGEGLAAFTLKLHAVSRHPRGVPGLVLDLTQVPVPDELDGDARKAQSLAARLLRERPFRDALLADARVRMRALTDDFLELCRGTLGVESASTEAGLALPRAADAEPAGGTGPEWVWLSALAAEGLAHPELVEGIATFSVDGGGTFDSGGVAADGGGSFTSGGHDGPADSGGGSF